jgi:hypothetical protein
MFLALKENLIFAKPEFGTMVFMLNMFYTKVQHYVATKLFLRS